jgi:hypothetical protein
LEARPLIAKAASIRAWERPPWIAESASVRYIDEMWLYRSEGFTLLRALLKAHRDSTCYLVMLSPDDPEEYRKSFGGYPVNILSSTDSNHEYSQTMMHDPSGGPWGISPFHDLVVILGEKDEWAIYADRITSVAMIVSTLSADDALEAAELGPLNIVDVREALPREVKMYL